MTGLVEKALKDIQNPEIQDMLRRLSAYGLGIFVPHMHTTTEDFAPLPPGMVQMERNLQVSFESRADAVGSPVGWIWDDRNPGGPVLYCSVCGTAADGQHTIVGTSHEGLEPEPDGPEEPAGS